MNFFLIKNINNYFFQSKHINFPKLNSPINIPPQSKHTNKSFPTTKHIDKYIKIFFQTKQQQQQQLNTSINIFAKLNTTINKKKYFQTKNINKYPLQKIIKKTKNN
jgi:hypothetical protein